MQKADQEKVAEDYQRIWGTFPLDYKKEELPPLKICYANLLSRPLFYPVNKFAYGLLLLMRRKSFTKKEVEHLRNIGFSVEIEVRQVELPGGIR